MYQHEAETAIAHAAASAKRLHDRRRTPAQLQVGDRVYLNLHHGYKLPGKPHRKWSQQRTGPFTVKRKAGELAVELDLPPTWRVHPVVSITQLTLAPDGDDPFGRRPVPPGRVLEAGSEDQQYELERIVQRRVTFGTG